MSKPKIRFKGFIEDWEQRKFSELVTIERGGSPRPIDKFITNDENGLNWVKIGDAPEQGNYITQTAEKIRPEGLSKTREVHPGDLILSNSMSFGRPYIMAIDGCIHDGWLAIRDTKKNFDLKFLCTLLGTDGMLNQYKAMAAGSTVNNLNKELVGGTTVAFPMVEEQIKIGDYFTTIDHLITLHQRKYEEMKKFKKCMLQKMFPQNGKNIPEIRFEGFTEDWEQRKLGDILERRVEQRQQSEEYPRLAFASGQGVIPLSERRTNNREQLIKDEFTKKYLVTEMDDIVYNPANVKYGAIDRNKCGRGLISPIYVTFTTNEISGFIERIVTSHDFQQKALRFEEGTVTKRQSVNPEDFITIDIVVAPQREEQKKISDYFDQLDHLITLHQRKYEELQKIKKFMLQNMFI